MKAPARFLYGAADHHSLLKAKEGAKTDGMPVVAFAGRSNVGKSSLLNALAGTRIARVSSEPGRTREINIFSWGRVILADLPGYGYAKVAQSMRAQWGKEIPKFLQTEPDLALVVSLVDGRHGFSKDDRELVAFLQENEFPYVVVFTKMDKMKSANQMRAAERMLAGQADELGVAEFLFVSAEKGLGMGALSALVHEIRQTRDRS